MCEDGRKLNLATAAVVFLVLGCAVIAKAAEEVSPLSVSDLRVTATIPGRLDLSWKGDEKTRPIYYYIHRSTTLGFVPSKALRTPPEGRGRRRAAPGSALGKDTLVAEVPGTRLLDWGLKEGVTYYYRVVAGDKDGNEGKPSNEAGGKTLVSPKLAAPKTLGPTDITGKRVWKRRDITVNGTINIKPGGSLTIDASKVTFNNTERDKWGILIKPGGRLVIRNGSFITAAKKGLHWWVYTNSGKALIQVKDSRFSRLGTKPKYHPSTMGSDKRNIGYGFMFYGEVDPKTYFKRNEFFECAKAIWSMGGIPKVIDNTFRDFVGRSCGVYTRRRALIENNRFMEMRFAIYSNHTTGLTIKDNTFNRITSYCIDIFAPNENLVATNNIIRNSWKGFALAGRHGPHKKCLVEGNTFTNSYGALVGAADNSVVRNNVVDTVDDGYYAGSHSTYENNRVSNAGCGLDLWDRFRRTASHSVFRGNRFFKARGGKYGVRNWRWDDHRRIVPRGASHNLMVDTTISGFPYGLSLLYGKANVFRDLKVSESKIADIYLMGCNEGTKFVNVKYSTVKINDKAEITMPPWKVKHKIADFKPDQFLVYYYLDVKVVDKNGRPVPGAQVTVENVTQPDLPAINMLGQTKKEFVTGPDGHTPLPTDEKNSAAIPGFKQTTSSKVKMTHRIVASKVDGSGRKRTSSVAGLSPDESWYRKECDHRRKTIVITLPFAWK